MRTQTFSRTRTSTHAHAHAHTPHTARTQFHYPFKHRMQYGEKEKVGVRFPFFTSALAISSRFREERAGDTNRG